MNGLLLFAAYFATGVALLALFIAIYVKSTPYHEFELIRQNNVAAAICLSGAALGFTLPLVSTIYFTHSLLEMAKWSLVTGGVQLALFRVMRPFAVNIENGHVAPAVFLAALSVATGLINAVCISY